MKKHVLLIEDDKTVRENTAEILQFADYKVTTASNGKIGVELVKKERPDIIVCDIMMPKLDGYGVFQILAKDKKLASIPFIFLSAKTNHSEIRKGMDLGADDYITKPFEESELLMAISIRLKKIESLRKYSDKVNKTIDEEQNDIVVNDIKELIKIFCKRAPKTYQKGDSLFCEGNRSNHLFLVKKGLIKTFKTTQEGKELITGLYKNNQFIGYTSALGDFPHTENAEALENTKIIKIDKLEIFSILRSNPNIALSLLGLLANNIKITKEKLVQVAYDSVRGRTAKSLLVLLSNNSLNKIIISRTDLANLTGIAKETLIRTLSDFKDEGYIQTSRTYVKVIDKKGLMQVH